MAVIPSRVDNMTGIQCNNQQTRDNQAQEEES